MSTNTNNNNNAAFIALLGSLLGSQGAGRTQGSYGGQKPGQTGCNTGCNRGGSTPVMPGGCYGPNSGSILDDLYKIGTPTPPVTKDDMNAVIDAADSNSDKVVSKEELEAFNSKIKPKAEAFQRVVAALTRFGGPIAQMLLPLIKELFGKELALAGASDMMSTFFNNIDEADGASGSISKKDVELISLVNKGGITVPVMPEKIGGGTPDPGKPDPDPGKPDPGKPDPGKDDSDIVFDSTSSLKKLATKMNEKFSEDQDSIDEGLSKAELATGIQAQQKSIANLEAVLKDSDDAIKEIGTDAADKALVDELTKRRDDAKKELETAKKDLEASQKLWKHFDQLAAGDADEDAELLTSKDIDAVDKANSEKRRDSKISVAELKAGKVAENTAKVEDEALDLEDAIKAEMDTNNDGDVSDAEFKAFTETKDTGTTAQVDLWKTRSKELEKKINDIKARDGVTANVDSLEALLKSYVDFFKEATARDEAAQKLKP